MLKSFYISVALTIAASVIVSARAPVREAIAVVAIKDQGRLVAEPDSRPQKFLTWPGLDLL